jgi:hypothetical protein
MKDVVDEGQVWASDRLTVEVRGTTYRGTRVEYEVVGGLDDAPIGADRSLDVAAFVEAFDRIDEQDEVVVEEGPL